jgi:3-isopropylmalate/(R)-2-methylmalate dehydratase large subunit
MGLTIAEKIISAHAGRAVKAGDFVVARVDAAMASDTTAPLAIRAFEAMGGRRIRNPRRCFLVIDHAAPAPNERIANLHAMMRDFAGRQGCGWFEAGEGICHQLMVERGIVGPGDLVVGADSHTCTYGAVGAMGVGVGSTDLAAVLLTGKIWLRVPETVRVVIDGTPDAGVQGKDLVLAVLARTGTDGASYRAIEFSGRAVAALSLAGRMTMANMAIEAGAKTGFIDAAGPVPAGGRPVAAPDADADYVDTFSLDAAAIPPMVSRPHSPDNAVPVGEVAGTAVDYAFIGTCVNGRLEDLRTAARVLRGARVHPRTRLVIGPASRQVFLEALQDGTVQALTEAGATFIPPGCGPCVGTHHGVPGNAETVISAANRNFKGRMGNPLAAIYLASPATVAAAAREGRIVDPRPYLSASEAA